MCRLGPQKNVWLADWQNSWGEHTLSPGLRMVPQKKFPSKNNPWARLANFLGRAHPQPWSERVVPSKKKSYPQKSRQGLMAQPWARLATLPGESARSALVLRAEPSGKNFLQKSRQRWMAKPWARLANFDRDEHAFSPGLRVVHQKKFYPQKSRQGWMALALVQTVDRSSGESARSALVRR